MNNLLTASLLSLLISFFGNEVALAGELPVRQAELTRLLGQASAEVGSAFPEIPGQLTLSSAFSEISKNAAAYGDAALLMLSSGSVDERKKLILAYAVQSLCLKDLVELNRQALIHWKRGAISTTVLDVMLFPVYDWNTLIQQNYRRPDVAALLRDVQRQQVYAKYPTRAKYLTEVISGRAAKDIEHLRRDGQLERRNAHLNCED